MFGRPTIISCDVEFNYLILMNEGRLVTAAYQAPLHKILGEKSLLALTGDAHKRMYGIALTILNTLKSPEGSFLSDIERTVLDTMESWKGKDTLVFVDQTRKVTYNVMVKQLLGLDATDAVAIEMFRDFETFVTGFFSVPINLPGMAFAKAVQARKNIWEKHKKIIKQRKGGDKRNKKDFLDLLMAQDMTEEEICSLLLNLLHGGYDTTSMLIALVAKFLSEDPKILKELREEHLTIRQSKNENEPLNWHDYNKMQLTQNIINESLRLGNIVKFAPRVSIQPIKYKDFEIPAGYGIITMFSGVHLDDSVHEDPFKFNPYRWENNDMPMSKKLMTFGGGKRWCLGSDVSRMETCVFMHHFVLKYSWTPIDASEWPINRPYIQFKDDFPLKIEPLELG